MDIIVGTLSQCNDKYFTSFQFVFLPSKIPQAENAVILTLAQYYDIISFHSQRTAQKFRPKTESKSHKVEASRSSPSERKYETKCANEDCYFEKFKKGIESTN